MSSSSDDFFQNPLSSPPKQSTALNRRPSESNKPKTRTATTRRAPPPPPKPSSSGAASASGTAATTVTNRRRPAASSTGTASAASGRSSYKSTRSIPSSAATTLKPKAAASTVPTSFYGSSPSTAPAGDRSDTGLYGFSSNVSNTAAAASASTNSLNNNSTNSQPQWDSWAAPPASASTTSTTSNTDWGSTSNTDWGAPAPTASNAPTSNDSAGGWFTGGTASTNSATSAADPALTQWQAPNPAATGAAPMPSSSSSLQGSMDTTSTPATMAPMTPNIFQPQDYIGTTTSNNMDDEDFENEPPLLEELGIHFDHILLKTKTVCWPFQRTSSGAYDETEMVDAVVQDADLIGPICYCLLLGGEMVLTGKLQFGYIYGFGLFGCIAMTLVVNLTAPQDAVSFWVVASVLGYALIPVNILALVKVIVINLASLQTLGRFLAVVTVAWSTTAATRLLEMGCGLRQQRYLIAYPIALLYSAFVLITIF